MWRHEAEPLAKGHATIEVIPFDKKLQVDFAREVGASVIIRGLRAVSDFEYEFQMAAMNQRLNMDVETVVIMADPRYQAIASRLVKEIADTRRRREGLHQPLCRRTPHQTLQGTGR